MNNTPDSSAERDEGTPLVGRAVSESDSDPSHLGSSKLADYEIVRELGRGGTSIVYEARQTALRRNVALKRLPSAATFDERWLVRFQNEVRSVAQLNHPNIVAFFEAGHDGDSHFYTMQLIDGISLAEVIKRLRQCRESAGNGAQPCKHPQAEAVHPALLSLCERCTCPVASARSNTSRDAATTSLERDIHWDVLSSEGYHEAIAKIIVDAARALDYAHEQGILHLDVKPSNLLLDRSGKVWVTDFGASCSDSGSGSSTAGGRAGTLRYMSPEQMLGGKEPLDRRSDVYSLGATLYELLTLQRPFGDQPAQASSPHAAIHPAGSPREANASVPRELEAVVQKATKEVPDQRYASAGELAGDLQRFLDRTPVSVPSPAGRERLARRPSRRKLVAGMILLIPLIALLAVVAGNLLRDSSSRRGPARGKPAEERGESAGRKEESRHKTLAHAAAVVAEIDRLLTQDTREQGPRRDLVGDPVNLLEALDAATREIGDGGASEPALAGELHQKIADVYYRLGEFGESATHYQAALDLLDKENDLSTPQSIEASIQLGSVLTQLGEWDEAEEILRNCLEASVARGMEHPAIRDSVIQLHKLLQLQDKDDEANGERIDLLKQHIARRRQNSAEDDRETLAAVEALIELSSDAGNHEEAATLLQELVAGRRRVLGDDHRETLIAENLCARSLLTQGKPAEAEQAMRDNLDTRRRLLGDKHLDTIESTNDLAIILMFENQFDEAERLFRQARDLYGGRLGFEHPHTIDCAANLARLLMMRNKLAEAEQLGRANWDVTRRTRGEEHLNTIKSGVWLSSLLRYQGDYEQGEKIASQCLTAARTALGKEHTWRGEAVIALSLTLRAQGQVCEAEPVELEELGAIFKKKESSADHELLATTFLEACKFGDAEQWGRTALDTKRQGMPPDPPISLAATLALLGHVLVAEDKLQEAEPLLRESLAIRKEALPEQHALVGETESRLGDCLARQGQHEQAEPLLINSYRSVSATGSSTPLRTLEMLQRIADLYDRWSKPEEVERWGRQLEAELRAQLASQKASPPTCGWRVFETESRLGACLAILGQVDEAQPLLYGSHTRLLLHWTPDAMKEAKHLRRPLYQAIDRIAWFHQRREQSDLAAAWRALLVVQFGAPSAEQAQDAVALWEAACQEQPDLACYATNLGASYRSLAVAMERAKKQEEAASWYTKAEEIFTRLLESDPDNNLAAMHLKQCQDRRNRLQKKRAPLQKK